MLSNNALFQVLVTSGNQAVAAAGTGIGSLAIGKIGVFNADSNLAVDATTALKASRFYLAVGINPDGGTVPSDISKSAGYFIQANGIKGYTARCYTPAQPQILDITDFFAKCESDYGIRFVLQNPNAHTRYGFQIPMKTFIVHTSCCGVGCNVTCKNFAAEAAYLLVNEINADSDALMSAELIDYTTTPGTPIVVPIEDYQTWVDAHTTVDDLGDSDPTNDVSTVLGLGIRITTAPSRILAQGSINLAYENPRGTKVVAALVAGFDCNGTVTNIQDIVYEENPGYDVLQAEYFAGGWNNRPGIYRQSALFGLAKQNIKQYADPAGKYLTFNLNYHLSSVEDRTYETNMDTVVVVPCADTLTRDGLVTILDAIVGRFGGDTLADDVTACAACDTVNTMTAGYALDGITLV